MDDGGGVGVLIEVARRLGADRARRRTLVFASFDGEEAWATGRGTTAGSRAYIAALGPQARDLAAAFVIEMCGWPGGTPVLHPIPYADPLRPGTSVVTPAWLLRAAQDGARRAGQPLPVGDPLISWLYQPAVRLFRAGLYGDDLSFVQARLPAWYRSGVKAPAFLLLPLMMKNAPFGLIYADAARPGARRGWSGRGCRGCCACGTSWGCAGRTPPGGSTRGAGSRVPLSSSNRCGRGTSGSRAARCAASAPSPTTARAPSARTSRGPVSPQSRL